MKITAIAAGLAVAAAFTGAAPADAQGHAYGHYKHFDRYDGPRGYHGHGYGRPYGYRSYGYRPRGYGYGYGYGYGHGRLVCRYRFGGRRCFRAY